MARINKNSITNNSDPQQAELYRYSAYQMTALSGSFMPYQVTLDQTYPYHWLEFFELGLILDGTSKHVINGEIYPLQPGSLFLLSPADFHSMIISVHNPVNIIGIVFKEQMIQEELKQLLFSDSYFLNLDLDQKELLLIQPLLTNILHEFRENQPGSRILVSAYLQNILVYLARIISKRSSPNKAILPHREPHPESIQQSLIYIHHHFRQSITLEDAAAQAYLSPHYFSERFHQTMGNSFQRYLQNLRLQFAAGLLAATDRPVSEILFAAGFNDPTHFGRVFKQVFLDSPRDYRKKHHHPVE